MGEKGAAKVWRIKIPFSKKSFKVIVAALYLFNFTGTFDFCQRRTFPVGDFMHCFSGQCTTSFHMKFLMWKVSVFSLTYFPMSCWYIESNLSLASSRCSFVYLVDLMRFLAAALVKSFLGL